jgi:hypothetical protein
MYFGSGALLSPCKRYRYQLWRDLRLAPGPTLVVIGFNPSTADGHVDDPTIRRCVGFAIREQCRRLVMLNLFALRSTDPTYLHGHPDPVGPANDDNLLRFIHNEQAITVVAWGDLGTFKDRHRAVSALIRDGHANRAVHCLGLTKSGNPRHPLYVSKTQPFLPFEL